MLQEETKKKDGNKKRYVYLNKFNEYKEETEKRFKHIDKELESTFERLVGFTIILAVIVIAGIAYSIFR